MLRLLTAFVALAAGLHAAPPEPPRPATVAVIYNSSLQASEALARSYAEKRGIPLDNLVGLPLPETEQITRGQFDSLIHEPLTAAFDERDWWSRSTNTDGRLEIRSSKIRILVCVRGVPVKVKHPDPEPEPGDKPVHPQQRQMTTGSAAVDSELTLLGNEGLPIAGWLNNPYFKSEKPFAETRLPMFLVGRIDGPSFEICERLIEDAIATEATGLWGWAVVDLANKIPQGDAWLRSSATVLDDKGIPTLLDRFDATLPTDFPLPDAAFYLGWYDGHVSGPFKNPAFHFRCGAVAVHLHSFSAAGVRSAERHWCGPLLARGAAATIGNVYEPFLHLTHHFDLLTERLLAGYTLVEAAYMAVPSLSWQAIVIGDPLYRPFVHLDGSGRKTESDRIFRALRVARLKWSSDESERETQLRKAAGRMNDPRLLEAVGLHLHLIGRGDQAAGVFREALTRFTSPADRLRMDLHIARIDRESSRNAAAIRQLRTAVTTYGNQPGVKAASAWLNVLDPPPPPPATAPADR